MNDEQEKQTCNFKLPLPTRETFEGADTETKLNYLFDLTCVGLTNQNEVRKFIENQRKRDRKLTIGISSGMGALMNLIFLGAKALVKGIIES